MANQEVPKNIEWTEYKSILDIVKWRGIPIQIFERLFMEKFESHRKWDRFQWNWNILTLSRGIWDKEVKVSIEFGEEHKFEAKIRLWEGWVSLNQVTWNNSLYELYYEWIMAKDTFLVYIEQVGWFRREFSKLRKQIEEGRVKILSQKGLDKLFGNVDIFRAEDIRKILDNNPEIFKYINGWKTPLSIDQLTRALEKSLEKPKK